MARSKMFPTVLLLLGFFLPAVVRAQSPGDELAPLPIAPTAEQLHAVASLSPFAEPIPSGMPPEDAKHCIRVFTSQGRWPIRVEYEDGSQYWGEVTRIDMTTFELWNRKTNQTTTLGYAGMCGIEKVKDYGTVSKYSLYTASLAKRGPEPARPLTPEELTYKRAAEHFALFDRRFVRCELKDHSVVTGAIVFVGQEDFTVRPGKLHEDRVIPYRELSGPPRPTAAVGAHFRNALEMTGLVAFCVVLLPVCTAATGD